MLEILFRFMGGDGANKTPKNSLNSFFSNAYTTILGLAI
ncbi:hypothetical protein AsAng_0020600 [Aureispira anguillae]|uniref:Uncharacterized protein n=1 Tax=Aureispira anguillae TaxID=2864201 RepID=A0A915YDZ2_9BACT|nr:hypothetical protein AsAng_0020600 [Aureispira anguillae]